MHGTLDMFILKLRKIKPTNAIDSEATSKTLRTYGRRYLNPR
jgi:hypothetical protein